MRKPKQERGTVMVLFAIALPVLVGSVALAIDVGLMLSARTQLQSAADAAALAGMQSLRDDGSVSGARAEAEAYAGRNVAIGENVELDAGDVTVGRFDFDSNTFSPGAGFGAPAIRVVARRDQGSPAGPLRLFFAPIVGIRSADVVADAIATLPRRDLVLAQDRTNSFVDEFPSALEADRDLVRAMADQGLAGDQMGLVSFARDTIDEAQLTELASGQSALITAINGMDVCTVVGNPGDPCYGTDIGAGIDAAREMLEEQSTAGDAVRVIVVVSDGAPCFLELGNRAVQVGQATATAAADRADAEGITIFVVTLDQGGGGAHVCQTTDPRFNESLARGFGRGFTTTREEDLDDLLTSILNSMPVLLVE